MKFSVTFPGLHDSAIVWDPYYIQYIDKLERIQSAGHVRKDALPKCYKIWDFNPYKNNFCSSTK